MDSFLFRSHFRLFASHIGYMYTWLLEWKQFFCTILCFESKYLSGVLLAVLCKMRSACVGRCYDSVCVTSGNIVIVYWFFLVVIVNAMVTFLIIFNIICGQR